MQCAVDACRSCAWQECRGQPPACRNVLAPLQVLSKMSRVLGVTLKKNPAKK